MEEKKNQKKMLIVVSLSSKIRGDAFSLSISPGYFGFCNVTFFIDGKPNYMRTSKTLQIEVYSILQ